MNMTKPVLSVLITAYNQPKLLHRCLSSIGLQTYRPLEIIVSDDLSPVSLEPIVSEFSSLCDPAISVIFVRPENNLHCYHNYIYAMSFATGVFAIKIDHDDILIDNSFFEEAINCLTHSEACYVYIGNTVMEGTNICALKGLNSCYRALHNGIDYILDGLMGSLSPVNSGVVFNLKMLHSLGYKSFEISKDVAKRLCLLPDEGFVGISLLASNGNIFISGNVVSVRGMHPDQVSRSTAWIQENGRVSFIAYFLLFQYFKSRGILSLARLYKSKLISQKMPYFDHGILCHLDSYEAYLIMICNLAL